MRAVRAVSWALAASALGGCAPRAAEPEGVAPISVPSAQPVQGAPPAIAGRLEPQAIQATLRARLRPFRACYARGLARDRKLRGRVVTGFVIQLDGTVLASSIADAGSTLPDPDVIACIQGELRTLTFQRPEGGLVTVVYPMAFDAGD